MGGKSREAKVAKVAKQLGCEKETAVEVCRQLNSQQLIWMLTAERIGHNLTQKDVAQAMGVSESTVCRMEQSDDADLNFGSILAYSRAVRLNMSILFDDEAMPIATRVKHCVFKIADMLAHLTDLANEDDEDNKMRDAIHRFQGEVLMNFLIKYQESGAALPSVRIANGVESGEIRYPSAPCGVARQSARAV